MSKITSKALAPVVARGRIALRAKPDSTVDDLAKAMLTEAPVELLAVAPQTFPDVPSKREITKAQEEALIALPGVFGKVQPTERRTLQPEEVTALFAEREVLKTLGDLLKGREEDIKTLVRHHLDVEAEEQGRAVPKPVIDPGTHKVIVEATPRDAHGHYVLCAPEKPERLNVPGTDKAFSREFRTGTIQVDADLLLRLHEDGDVSREDYLAFTREVRVFDKAKALAAISKNTDLLGLLAKISRKGLAGSSIQVRKAK